MRCLLFIVFLFLAQTSFAVITSDEFATKVAGLDDLEFKDQLISKWQEYNRRYFGRVIHFQQKELARFIPKNCVAFVPNTELNILPLFAIYPFCQLYVLTGNYDVTVKYIWNIADIDRARMKEQIIELIDIDSSYYTGTNLMMHVDFTTNAISMLKLLGNKVLSIIPIFLHKNGELSLDQQAGALSGVQIAFRINNDLPIQAIVYFPTSEYVNQNLSNFLQKQGRIVTLISKNQYELQRAEQKELAQNIIDKSWIIVQDETGVPFSDISAEKWFIKHYGYYLKQAVTQEDFEHFQEALFASYNRLGAQKINFNFSLRPFSNSLSFLMKKDIVKLLENTDKGE